MTAKTPVTPAQVLSQPLTLPCGATLPNRLVKAAMTEGLSDGTNMANDRYTTLYRRWGKGGAGLLITGNVLVDRWHLERGGNLAIEGEQSNAALAALSDMASAAKEHGSLIVMQLNHAGRQTQTIINPHPKSASDVALQLGKNRFGAPSPMTTDEVEQTIDAFVNAAQIARQAGFDGVQIHAAHGYLINQFLSGLSNRRSDAWGGSLAGRARLLLEITRRIRSTCPMPFIVAVKLNSADFQRGGFSEEDSAQVAAWLEGAGCDLIEVSGGNYEQPRMFDFDRLDPLGRTKRNSTRVREAYFLDFVPKLRSATGLPVMVTGGFRNAATMAQAIKQDGVDLIGLARPLVINPDGAADLLAGRTHHLTSRDHDLTIGPGPLGPNSSISFLRDLNAIGALGWYYENIYRLANGREPNLKFSPLRAVLAFDKAERKAAKALIRNDI